MMNEMTREEAARAAARFLREICKDSTDDMANITYAESCVVDNTNPNQDKVLISYLESIEEFIIKVKTTLIRK